MPNILQRYLFKQFFWASTNTTLLFVFVLILGNALKEILPLLTSGKIEWSFFFDVLLHLIPSMIAYALPLGMLTATLLVLGRLSAQNEITAMKASGLSLYSIVTPVFFLAGLGTFFALMVNFYFGPASITYYRSALSNIIRQRPLQFVQAGTFIKDFPGYIFYIEKKHNDFLDNCWLWELDSQNPSGINLFLHSETGYIHYDNVHNNLILTLVNGIGEKHALSNTNGGDVSQPISFQKTSIALLVHQIFGSSNFRKKLGYMDLKDLLSIKKQYQNALPKTQAYTQKMAASLEIQKNTVMSFAVLSLILIAIPLGIKVSRAETSANIVLAIALALSYYFIVMAISWLETKPAFHPDILIWIPNFLFQTLGIVLFRKISLH